MALKERISNGDLEYKVAIKDPDIAATLASSFNQMAASLNQSSTELKKTYAELAQQEKLAAVGQMTAGIAHEIKNPLGIIQGSAQVVVNRKRPFEMREKAAVFILEEVERLNNTLTTFLDFARPPSPHFRPADITVFLEDILDAAHERYSGQGFAIDKDFPAMAPKIIADADQIRELFLNIVINAIQSMPEGGTILVRMGIEKGKQGKDDPIIPMAGFTCASADFLMISITDQGCGINPDQMRTIFDPFVSFRDKGIGLGLSIVSQIVKSHKGQIKIKSTPGKGTQFKLRFPIIS